MTKFITVVNDGKNLIDSNYWDSDLCQAGKFYLSINAGCLRVLLPNDQYLAEMKTANKVEIEKKNDIYFIWFVDNTESPFCLQATKESFDMLPGWKGPIDVYIYTRGPTLELKFKGEIL